MKRRWDLFYFSAGVLMAAAAFVLWQSCIVVAEVNYSENYTVTGWRNVKFTSPEGTREHSLGPAEWTVTGSAGEVDYSESWQATDWKDRTIPIRGTYSYAQPTTTQFLNSANFDSSSVFRGAEGSFYQLLPSGLYGAALFVTGVSYSGAGAVSSLPAKWEVTGTINTP